MPPMPSGWWCEKVVLEMLNDKKGMTRRNGVENIFSNPLMVAQRPTFQYHTPSIYTTFCPDRKLNEKHPEIHILSYQVLS